jgi:hypothetical protein
MLSDSYEDRLGQWRHLRTILADQSFDQCLLDCNDWWWRTPMRDRVVLWQDYPNWPDPWQLLSEPAFCDLARSLGIAYTLLLVERKEIEEIHLVQTKTSNLVLINEGKYVLNWEPGSIVNTHQHQVLIQRCITGQDLAKKLR